MDGFSRHDCFRKLKLNFVISKYPCLKFKLYKTIEEY